MARLVITGVIMAGIITAVFSDALLMLRLRRERTVPMMRM